jgi:glyoxylase-like metal-dependent hydrolase (beta-lactamase superfamily II)
MLNIERFVFNSFMVNTYVIYDETGEAVVIDAACYDEKEKAALSDFIKKKGLKVVRNITTHCHIDHILGNGFIEEQYGIRPEYHRDSVPFLRTAAEIGASFGYQVPKLPEPAGYLEEGDVVKFGNSELKVLFTPGHAAGHLCFYHEPERFLVTGDVLFRDTIGRTDLPSGDFNLLMESIKNKLFTLPDDVTAYPGHGPETSIGYEKVNNPFIR